MISLAEIKKSLLVSLWFMFLTFPIMVIRVNTVENVIEWRWINLLIVGLGSFFLSFVWRYFIKKQETGKKNLRMTGFAFLIRYCNIKPYYYLVSAQNITLFNI